MKYIVLLFLFFGFSSDANEKKAIFSAFNIALESFTTRFDHPPKSIKEAIKMAHETVARTKLGENSENFTPQGWKNLGDQAIAMALMFYEISQQADEDQSVNLDNSLVAILYFIEQMNGDNGYFTKKALQLKMSP